MAKPNVGHVERARRALRLDASELAQRIKKSPAAIALSITPAFRHLVQAAQAGLDDHHFWAGLDSTRYDRDLRLLIEEKFKYPLDRLRNEYRRMREIDVFEPLLDDSKLDAHLAAAVKACDSILAQFRTDHLPEWMRDDKDALALNLKFPTKASARTVLADRIALAFRTYAEADHHNRSDAWKRRALFAFTRAVFKTAGIPFPTKDPVRGPERLFSSGLRFDTPHRRARAR
jgi:hypothetical protein